MFKTGMAILIIAIMIGVLVVTSIGCCCTCTCTCTCPCPTECCECGEWGQATVSWQGCDAQRKNVDCGKGVDITICPYSEVIINSSITCGNNCQLTVSWVIKDAANTLVANGTSFTASFTPASPGIYTVSYEATCGDVKCDPCSITINVKEILASSLTRTFTVGVCDNFDTSNGDELTSPSQALLNLINTSYGGKDNSRNCDDITTMNQYWAHTFLNLAPPACYQIQSAKLTITVYNGDVDNDNDALLLGFISSNTSTWAWSSRLTALGVPVGSNGTIIHNCDAAMLASITSYGFLDVVVQDDSGVDCAQLVITYVLTGCPGTTPPITTPPLTYTTLPTEIH